MVNSNIGPNSAPLRDIRHWNPSDLNFDLSRPLKVKSDDVIALATYGFLLMVKGNIGPNLAPLGDTIGFEIWVSLTLTFQGQI